MPSHNPLSRTVFRGLAVGLVGVVLAATAVGCTGGDDEDKSVDPSTPMPTAPVSAPLKVSVQKVAGDLSKKTRKRVVRNVTETLQGYVDGAFLGDYPRNDFALARFTDGAEKLGRKDLDLLTGRQFGGAESVTAKQLKAQLSVLAPGGHPAGVTARVRWALDVDGTPVTFQGRLMLTQHNGSWRIFGYDVSSNASDAKAAAGKEG